MSVAKSYFVTVAVLRNQWLHYVKWPFWGYCYILWYGCDDA